MQSASATVPWGVITKEESIERGLRLAELMNCRNEKQNITVVIDCLRKANATEMVCKEWDVISEVPCDGSWVWVVDGGVNIVDGCEWFVNLFLF